MKKILALLAVAVLALAGCSGSSDAITFLAWNMGTEEQNSIERQMIAEFEKQNPEIKVDIVELDGADYGEYLNTKAAAGELPDVFMVPNVSKALTNEWLLDVTEFVSTEDFNQVIPSLQEAAKYEEQIVAIPASAQLLGYFANNEVIEKAGLTPLAYGYTKEQLDTTIQKSFDAANGVSGIAETIQISDIYTTFGEGQNYFTFDGSKYSLDSDEFKAGIQYAADMNKYAYAQLTNDQKVLAGSDEASDYDYTKAWDAGSIGVRFEGLWQAKPWIVDQGMDQVEYIGLPGGKSVIAGDFYGVSSTTKKAADAVKLAEFMSYGGYETRAELYNASEKGEKQSLSPSPSTKQAHIDLYTESMTEVKGVKEAMADLDKAVVEPTKFVPGYVMSRWDALTGMPAGDKSDAKIADVIFDATQGKLNYNDYAAKVNELANKEYETAKAALKPAPKFVAE